jgi:hypothetical protein
MPTILKVEFPLASTSPAAELDAAAAEPEAVELTVAVVLDIVRSLCVGEGKG